MLCILFSLTVDDTMKRFLDKISESRDVEFGLVVDGPALALILPDQYLKKIFLEVLLRT